MWRPLQPGVGLGECGARYSLGWAWVSVVPATACLRCVQLPPRTSFGACMRGRVRGQGEGGVRGRERGKGPQVFAEPWSSPDRGDGWAGPPPGAVRSAATEAVRLGTSSVVAARREVDKGATGGGGACVVQDMRAHGATWCCGVKGAGYKACVVKAMHAHGATWC